MFKITLISLAAWFYPYLFDNGMSVNCPIALVVQNRVDADNIIKKFPLASERITSTTTKDQTIDILTSVNLNAVFVFPQLPGGRKTRSVKHEQNCELAFDGVVSHMIGDDPVIAMVFFIFEKKIPDEYKGIMLELHMPCVSSNSKFDWSFLPDERDLSLINDKYCEIHNKEPHFEWLYMAVACMYVVLNKMDKPDQYPKVLHDVEEVISEFKSYEDTAWIVEEVSYYLMAYIESNCYMRIYNLNNLSVDVEDKLKNSVFFREKYMYIHSELIEKILSPILKYIKINVIKEILAEYLILLPDRSCYDTKMSYPSGKELKRVRMVKFDMTKIKDNDRTLSDSVNSIIY